MNYIEISKIYNFMYKLYTKYNFNTNIKPADCHEFRKRKDMMNERFYEQASVFSSGL